MISFLLRHLLESTFFLLLLSGLACCMRKGATARYAVLLMGVAKFAIPTVVLAKTGQDLASFWPAASWLSVVTYKVSFWLALIQNWFPLGHGGVILAVWALGTLAMLTLWLVQLRRGSTFFLLPTEGEQAAVLRVRRLLRVRGALRLRSTNTDADPALHGIWRPTITVPLGLIDRLTPAEFDGVLLHELAHARRMDNLTGAFVHCLVCVFWFHPLLWMVERRLLVERERACDETVMACGVKAQAYAAGILKVCQSQIFDPAPSVSAMTGVDLQGRLGLILDKPTPAGLLYVPWFLVAGLTAFMTLVPVAGGYCSQCASAPAVRCKTPATCTQSGRTGIR